MASKCSTCNKKVAANEHGLQCELCDKRCHIKCHDISEEEYEFLIKHKSLNWHCKECHKHCRRMLKLVGELEDKVSRMEIKYGDLSEKVSFLETAKGESKLAIEEMKIEIGALKQAMTSNETKLETAIEAKLLEKVEGQLKPSFAIVVAEQLETRLAEVSTL